MSQFLKKHGPLSGFLIVIAIYSIAIRHYPGGSESNRASETYNWQENYLCNLMSPKALNGEDNPVYILSVIGMMIFALSIASFFYIQSKKINHASISNWVRYGGIIAMVSTSLVFIWHDFFLNIALTLALLSIFLIVVFLFKEKKYLFGGLGCLNLLTLYVSCFIYYSGQFIVVLPVLQKVSFFLIVSWVIGLQYFYKAQTQ